MIHDKLNWQKDIMNSVCYYLELYIIQVIDIDKVTFSNCNCYLDVINKKFEKKFNI